MGWKSHTWYGTKVMIKQKLKLHLDKINQQFCCWPSNDKTYDNQTTNGQNVITLVFVGRNLMTWSMQFMMMECISVWQVYTTFKYEPEGGGGQHKIKNQQWNFFCISVSWSHSSCDLNEKFFHNNLDKYNSTAEKVNKESYTLHACIHPSTVLNATLTIQINESKIRNLNTQFGNK